MKNKSISLSFLPFIWLLTVQVLFAQKSLILNRHNCLVEDTYVHSLINLNYDKSPSLFPYAWTLGNNPFSCRVLLKFDMSLLPAKANIKSAKLLMYFNPYHDTISGTNYIHEGNNEFWVERITGFWESNLVTWSNQPATTSDKRVAATRTNSYNRQNYVIDVTDLVKDMRDSLNTNYGFMMTLANEAPFKLALFASSENLDESLWPTLVISYEEKLTGVLDPEKLFHIVQTKPNPFNSSFIVDIPESEMHQFQHAIFELFNTEGKLVHSQFVSSHFEVPTFALPSGSYWYKISLNHETLTTGNLTKL
ncbi:MAG: DNRLRE domain-containing protein [Saprospiraceae bacterium]|nr:DNRLRE domain-containing protein [Candidatus Defluviibacterium haderslevense]